MRYSSELVFLVAEGMNLVTMLKFFFNSLSRILNSFDSKLFNITEPPVLTRLREISRALSVSSSCLCISNSLIPVNVGEASEISNSTPLPLVILKISSTISSLRMSAFKVIMFGS
ncbi:MAG: hypothetical protein QXP74_00515 [Nitrososphaerota archaeon]